MQPPPIAASLPPRSRPHDARRLELHLDLRAQGATLGASHAMTEPVRRLPLPQQDRARGFAEALSTARGKHLLIALRGHPDPDGIASALAQAHIAQRLGVGKTTIGYCHELSHRENRALVKLLNVEMRKMKNIADVEKVDYLGLVDAHDVDPDLA